MSDTVTQSALHDYLIALVAAYLAPMLPGSDAQKIAAARAMVAALPVTDPLDVIEAAAIVAFKLASLASLRDASDPGIAPKIAARLRANAAVCERIAASRRARLEKAAPKPGRQDPQQTKSQPARQQGNAQWAAAMLREAERYAATMGGMSPSDRETAEAWRTALRSASAELSAIGDRPPAG
jgi:hypothetical protein